MIKTSINVSSAKIRLKGRLKLFHLRWQQREFQVFYSRTIKQSSIGNILDHFLLYFSLYSKFISHNGANAKCGFIKQKEEIAERKTVQIIENNILMLNLFGRILTRIFFPVFVPHILCFSFLMLMLLKMLQLLFVLCSLLLLHFNNFRCFIFFLLFYSLSFAQYTFIRYTHIFVSIVNCSCCCSCTIEEKIEFFFLFLRKKKAKMYSDSLDGKELNFSFIFSVPTYSFVIRIFVPPVFQ